LASRDGRDVEIHNNLKALGAYHHLDSAAYVIDVGVVEAGSVPIAKGNAPWLGLPNDRLITFIEAKAIVIYPMLLAQFIGIVHEIKPGFLDGALRPNFGGDGHFYPALVSLGYLHGTAFHIRAGYVTRNYRVKIVENLDIRLSGSYHAGAASLLD
jgi:hypothetical protein